MNYYYLSGESASLMNTLLPKEILFKLSSAQSFDDALEILRGTSYESYLSSTNIDDALLIEKNNLLSFIKKECEDKNVSNFFLLQIDYDNIESVCKARSKGLAESTYLESSGLYDFDFISQNIRQKNYQAFCNPFVEEMLNVYNQKSATCDIEPREFDYIFQSYKFKNLKALFSKGLMKELVCFLLDCENISIVMRCASIDEVQQNLITFGNLNFDKLTKIWQKDGNVFLETGGVLEDLIRLSFASRTIKNLANFELLKRKKILEIISSYMHSGINESEFVFYVYSKLFEIENLHLIFNLHRQNIGDRIKTRLIV